MEPQFQTSFIPKKPIIAGSSGLDSSGESINIFSVISTVAFIVMIIVCGALFAYEKVLNNQIADADAKVVEARDAFQLDTIKELIDVSNRISTTNRLLNSHIKPSEMFVFLQSLTFKNIRFSNFSYSVKGNEISVSMDAEAQSYNVLAQQSDVFSKNRYVKKSAFTGFSVSDNGTIMTKFNGIFDSSIISYKKVISDANTNQ